MACTFRADPFSGGLLLLVERHGALAAAPAPPLQEEFGGDDCDYGTEYDGSDRDDYAVDLPAPHECDDAGENDDAVTGKNEITPIGRTLDKAPRSDPHSKADGHEKQWQPERNIHDISKVVVGH